MYILYLSFCNEEQFQLLIRGIWLEINNVARENLLDSPTVLDQTVFPLLMGSNSHSIGSQQLNPLEEDCDYLAGLFGLVLEEEMGKFIGYARRDRYLYEAKEAYTSLSGVKNDFLPLNLTDPMSD